MSHDQIPFNRPHMTGKEFHYIAEANFGHMLAGDGPSPSAAMPGWKSAPVAARPC